MKKLIFITVYVLLAQHMYAQTLVSSNPEARELYTNARNYLQNADFANAIMVFNQAVQVDPENLILRRELANAYYMQGDLMRGEKMVMPLLKRDEADEQTFQVASNILAGMNKMDDAKDAINKGIDKFPNSGILYSNKGEIYTKQKKYKSAAAAWEKGIEKDPRYHLNYYNLSKVYFFTKNYIWAILYGETFVNLESFSSKSQEMKKIVFESYKFMIAELNNISLDGKLNRYDNPKNFEQSCLKIYDNLRNVVTGGINAENLTMLRIRFLLEWNRSYAKKYPSELIDHQQRFLTKGYYDTYNQWMFGKLDNDKIYKNWTQKNADIMNRFDQYFRNNKLQPRDNQYYHIN
jgi:tetratricopeptide (TPR) repeat protein